MNKYRFLSFIICIILTLFLVGSQMELQTEQLLLQTFQSVGAEPEHYVLHHGSRTTQLLARNQLDGWVKRIEESLHTTSSRKQKEPDGVRYTALGKIGRNLKVEINVINDEPQKEWSHPYVSIQVTGRGKPGLEWTLARKRVADILYSNGMSPHFHYSIQGSQPFPSSRLEQPIVQALEKLQAKEVESMRTNHTISISAYSPLLPNGLKTGGGLMNIQAATRVNHDTNRLIFTLGTPIITIEY